MDAYVDARLERVERALVTLTESVSKYKPSPAHGVELHNADEALSLALHKLQEHQTNHQTLTALHAQSDALDAQIRDTLRLLWATRKDITSTTITTFPAEDTTPRYNVNWEELLGYARRISKTTMPAPSILAAAAAAATATNGGGEDPQSAQSTGDAVNTPIITNVPTPAPGSATPNPQANGGGSGSGSATLPPPPPPPPLAPTDLPDDWERFLDPLTGVTFYPWPHEEAIRGGALASIEGIARQGIDPRGYDPVEEEARRQREEEERRVREEQEAREREEKVRLAREEQARVARERQAERQRQHEEAVRRGAAEDEVFGGGPPGGISPTVPRDGPRQQFQFMQDDDDDDDDD